MDKKEESYVRKIDHKDQSVHSYTLGIDLLKVNIIETVSVIKPKICKFFLIKFNFLSLGFIPFYKLVTRFKKFKF